MVLDAGSQLPLPDDAQPISIGEPPVAPSPEPGELPAADLFGQARIKVFGVGGGGVNTLRRMNASPIPGVELHCVNTDMASLQAAGAMPTINLGRELTRGLGAGGDPEVGRRAAEEAHEQIRASVAGADLVFIAAGMGGGTGTGAAPIIARAAREAGALTIAIVTTPFGFEGARRQTVGLAGLQSLRSAADTTVTVSNARLLSTVKRRTSMQEAFLLADQVIVDAIQAVSRIVNVTADINLDFADLKAVVADGGTGMMAIGHGGGGQRVLRAAHAAVESPLSDTTAHGARGVVFAVTGGPDVTISEPNEAGAFISSVADPDAQIFFGMQTDHDRKNGQPVELILIATRLPSQTRPDTANMSVGERVRLARERYFADDELPPFLGGRGGNVAPRQASNPFNGSGYRPTQGR